MSFTANPRAPKPDDDTIPHESAGPVASDSLAAESLASDGGFASNPSAAPLGVKGAQSTLATTDTSGATALHPAASGAERERQDALGAGSDERGSVGLKLDAVGKPDFDGVHSTLGYAGGPSGAAAVEGVAGGLSSFGDSSTVSASSAATTKDPQIRSGAQVNSSSSTTGTGTATNTTGGVGGPAPGAGVRPHVPQAPNYTASVTGTHKQQPKGTNLDDADVSGSMPESKTTSSSLDDVGGPKDPGRLAEKDFQARNAQGVVGEVSASGEPGGRQRQAGEGEGVGEEGGQYGALKSESA